MLRNIDDAADKSARVLVIGLGITDLSELRAGLELAKGLSTQKGAPVSISIATHARFRSQVKDLGMKFQDCGIDPLEARKITKGGKTLEACKHDSAAVGVALKGFMDTLITNWIEVGLSLLVSGRSVQADVVILASAAAIYCYMPICEENFIQVCVLSSSPCVPSMAFPPPKAFRGVSAVRREPTCTGQWAIYCQSVWRFLYKDAVDEQCLKHFKIGPHPSPFGPVETMVKGSANSTPLVLHAYSNSLLARPSDWPSHVHVVGSLGGALGPLPEADIKANCLPTNLRTFFDANPKAINVLVDLGPALDQWQDEASRAILLKQCITAITSLGHRAVIIAPASFGSADEEDFIILPALPIGSEHVLCRKCAAVVFSGDSFLAHTAIRAGTPLITLRLSGVGCNHESTAESEFWGSVLTEKGVAPPQLEAASLTVSLFAKTISSVLQLNSPQRAAVKAMALVMREDGCDGGAKAVKLVMSVAGPIASIRAAGARNK